MNNRGCRTLGLSNDDSKAAFGVFDCLLMFQSQNNNTKKDNGAFAAVQYVMVASTEDLG